ncbi:MAG: hypothetical protein V1745_03425 [Patescibacteria group bacterium]
MRGFLDSRKLQEFQAAEKKAAEGAKETGVESPHGKERDAVTAELMTTEAAAKDAETAVAKAEAFAASEGDGIDAESRVEIDASKDEMTGAAAELEAVKTELAEADAETPTEAAAEVPAESISEAAPEKPAEPSIESPVMEGVSKESAEISPERKQINDLAAVYFERRKKVIDLRSAGRERYQEVLEKLRETPDSVFAANKKYQQDMEIAWGSGWKNKGLPDTLTPSRLAGGDPDYLKLLSEMTKADEEKEEAWKDLRHEANEQGYYLEATLDSGLELRRGIFHDGQRLTDEERNERIVLSES